MGDMIDAVVRAMVCDGAMPWCGRWCAMARCRGAGDGVRWRDAVVRAMVCDGAMPWCGRWCAMATAFHGGMPSFGHRDAVMTMASMVQCRRSGTVMP
jgi:hypothetical protein